MLELNHIYNIDCIEGMKQIEENSIPLIIADPPYNISGSSNQIISEEKQYSSIKENWDNIENFEEFNKNWLKESFRVLKNGGSLLCWGSRHNIYLCGYLIQKIGFTIRTDYFWEKTNAMPNLTGRNASESTEHCIFATKGKNWTYNLKYAKQINKNKNIRNVFKTSMTPPCERKFGKHPSQKRLIDLTDHLIFLHSNEKETVLVPFCGSGTECLAARMYKRNYLGFDLSPEYIKIAENRIKDFETLALDL